MMLMTAADLVRVIELESLSARVNAPVRVAPGSEPGDWSVTARRFGSRQLHRLADALAPAPAPADC